MRSMLPEFLMLIWIWSRREPLKKLMAELGDRVDVLHHGQLNEVPHYLAMEIHEGEDNDPDSIINAFCKGSRPCPPASKRRGACAARRFDIGILSGTTARNRSGGLRLDLQAKTLERVAAWGADRLYGLSEGGDAGSSRKGQRRDGRTGENSAPGGHHHGQRVGLEDDERGGGAAGGIRRRL